MSPARHHHALPEGYHLHWYEIDSILGQGGFGITYLAKDTNLDQPVAIKEFLPSDLAVRTRDSAVHPLTGGHTDTYGWGLNRFLTEARTLAKFRHPNIVRVMSVFEANNTAYMVMEYERGESFENMLKFKQVRGEETLKRILLELLEGLELVHDAGFIHRDIKPSNVYLRDDGVPVLLDFGSARLALGVETRTLTSLVSPGYAPFEQYNATRESDKQGPWTDIYALGATIYRAVTGQGPVDAAARANMLLDEQRDPFEPCSKMVLPDFSPEFLHAIDRALAFPPAERPQSVAAWRQLIIAGAVDPEAATLAVADTLPGQAGVDIVLDGGEGPGPAPDASPPDTGTRTVPMAELEAAAASAAPPALAPTPAPGTGRGWFIATSVVVLAGVAMAAWLSLAPPEQDGPPDERPATRTSVVADPATTGAQRPVVAAANPQPPAGTQIEDAPAAIVTPEAPTPPSPATAAARGPVAAVPAEPPPAVPASTSVTPPPPVENSSQPAAPEPAPVTPKRSLEKTPPTKVAKAAPTQTKAGSGTPETASARKPSRARTRAEKVAALLDSAAAHMRADRLSKPKRSNALADYLTVLAIEKDNATAHQGIETIVERYVALARDATAAGRLDEATGHLKQARFVLDAMRLRKWDEDRYDALFREYREANRLLAVAR